MTFGQINNCQVSCNPHNRLGHNTAFLFIFYRSFVKVYFTKWQSCKYNIHVRHNNILDLFTF